VKQFTRFVAAELLLKELLFAACIVLCGFLRVFRKTGDDHPLPVGGVTALQS
jgi:hypothetical protein